MSHKFRVTSVALVVALALVVPATANIQNTVHRTFPVGAGGSLVVDADLGDISVATGGDHVVVDVVRDANTSNQKRADEIFRDLALTFDQHGSEVRVQARYDRPWSFFQFWNQLGLKFVITVPSRFSVDLHTSGGDIRIGNLAGTVACHTSGGDIEIGRINGTVKAKTSGGNVKLAAATGEAVVHTSGGNIHIDEAGSSTEAKTSGGSIDVGRVTGSLLARSSGGNIRIEQAGGAVDAHTSGGSVTAKLTQPLHAESRLTTSGGGITVWIPKNAALDLDAHTSGGDVVADVPVTIQGRHHDSSLVGKMNGGGAQLVLRTSGGDIHVKGM
ncbi:MAG TPA: DUF4097 family beta strand repeat-containing protein [Thermoanaerobaculia bacterium]|nr:DUF4097 family beta strand repeat-containing protein [Thermoanaerobaculia bacterium]